MGLVVGIFDNLAIAAKEKYNINVKEPSRISLANSSGRDFLKILSYFNPDLKEHICKKSSFISLARGLRETAIHREGFKMIGYFEPKKFVNFLQIDGQTAQRIKLLNDRTESGQKLSNWGLFRNEIFIFLESYHFAKKVGEELASFCDKFLKLLETSA